MKTTLIAIALAASLAQPASAITFSQLTTIYVGTGVQDSGGGLEFGIATIFQCTNVSGFSANLRFVVLEGDGAVAGTHSQTRPHGTSAVVGTHITYYFSENGTTLVGPGNLIEEGTINIESTQSGVFCQAYVTEAGVPTSVPAVIPLHLVRVNPHPGTVE